MAQTQFAGGDETPLLRRSPAVRGLEVLCAFLLAVLVVLLFIQVFARYALSDPPDWTEELARAVFVYLTFIGGAVAIVRNAHLKIDMVHGKLSPSARLRLDIALIMLGVVFLGAVLYQSFGLLGRLSHQPMTSVPISKAFVFAAVPIGCALMLVFELMRLVVWIRALASVRERHRDEVAKGRADSAGGGEER